MSAVRSALAGIGSKARFGPSALLNPSPLSNPPQERRCSSTPERVHMQKRRRSSIQQIVAPEGVCPYELETAKPYDQVPGPKPLPIFGNTWRLIPYIGQIQISDFATISQQLYDTYGRIVRLSGLIGRPDLLFIYDVHEIEKVYRREGPTPFRPSMPCLVKYKSEIRKDFFEDLPGVVGV